MQNIVLTAPSFGVKCHAAEKIADHQELLIEITRNSPDKDVREVAMKCQTDGDELDRILIIASQAKGDQYDRH